MARLIVLDASVVIAALASDDAHHLAAVAALRAATDDELVLAATTRAEILVGPSLATDTSYESAVSFVDGCATIPVTAPVADAAALIRATNRGLSLPDAISLAVADLIEADEVWTFDHRWRKGDRRVRFPE